FASYDHGRSWKKVYTNNAGIRRFYTLKSGYHIINHVNARLRRIAPDFSSGDDWLGASIATCLNSSYGIADNGNGTIMYAEYGTTAGQEYRIWKSTDDGQTWSICVDGTQVRHWHSVQVDPYTGYFW